MNTERFFVCYLVILITFFYFQFEAEEYYVSLIHHHHVMVVHAHFVMTLAIFICYEQLWRSIVSSYVHLCIRRIQLYRDILLAIVNRLNFMKKYQNSADGGPRSPSAHA